MTNAVLREWEQSAARRPQSTETRNRWGADVLKRSPKDLLSRRLYGPYIWMVPKLYVVKCVH